MTAPEPAVTYELPAGMAVGKYEIVRKIATGGMAEIYLARARGAAGFEKLVVLKRILPNVAEDPSFVQMFLDEARLAATLQHPNIADVYDVGEAAGTYFFTMEFVHGQDVRAIRAAMRAKNEQVPLAMGLAMVHGVAAALDYAHEKTGPDGKSLGLVHRDVSSSNVLVSYDGAVKLVDFGIARATSQGHKTQTGTLKGKIPYMSPEQCKGHPLDRRSDLWSLGVVLYELTVGRRPFRGQSDFEVMDQIVNKPAPTPSKLVASYPPELEAIVRRLLERQPDERYATAEEMLHDLEAFTNQNGLWVSTKALGKWMRGLFAEKITAMEQAERQGIPFVQHVAQTITSQSQKVDVLTPPSAYPGLPPRPSQEHMIARPTPTSMPTPDLRPKSVHRLVIGLAAAATLTLGGTVAYFVTRAHEDAKVVAPPPPVENSVKLTPEAPPPPPPPPRPPKPEPVKVEPPKPEPVKQEVVKPKPRPIIKKQPQQKKEESWDPNSPFLPGS